MKIAVNTRFLLKNKLEGIGWYTYEVLKRLVHDHPDDEFVFFFDRPYDPEFIFAPNVTPVVLFPQARHPFLYIWWFEFSVYRALKKYQPDVFLSPDGFLSLRSSVKTVMVTHDIAHVHFPEHVDLLTRKYYEFFVPRYLKRADLVITVSEYSKSDIHNSYGIPLSKINVSCNGIRAGFVPTPEKEQQHIREQYTQGVPFFCYVGSIHPRKNTARLIEAFDLFKKQSKSDWKLVLAGRLAWKTDEIHEKLNFSPYKEDIILTGYVPEEDLPKIIGSSEGMVYPSLFEGFGIPILEAMHTEVPVITSSTSSMAEVAGEAGILIDPYDPQSIADGMLQLFTTPSLKKVLIEKGKKQRALFSWEKAAKVVYGALEDVLLA